MLKPLTGFVAACAVLLAGSEVLAQASPVSPEHLYVFGSVGSGGYVPLDSGASEFGGALFGGGAGVFIGPHLTLEGAVDELNYSRYDWEGWHGKATAVLGRAVYRFGRPAARVRFLLTGAAGQVRDAWHYPPYQNPSGKLTEQREVFGAWGAGGGVDIRVHSRVFLRPEVSFLIGNEAYRRASISAGLAF